MKNRLLPLLLILLLALLLTPFFQTIIQPLIILPTLYFFWVGWLMFQSIPQAVVWSCFLGVALFIVVGNLLKKRPKLRPHRRVLPPTETARIERWVKLLQRANQETYYKWQLAQNLRKLAIAILAHDERLTPRQIQQRLLTDETLAIPPDIRTYMQASLTSFSHLPVRRTLKSAPTPLDLEPKQVIQFLEDKLT